MPACPRCTADLMEDGPTLRCPEGHGRFFRGDFVRRQHHPMRRLAKADRTVPTMPCPDCQATMVLTHTRRHDVDLCPGCDGLWLDAGEEKMMRQSPGLGPWIAIDAIAVLASLFG